MHSIEYYQEKFNAHLSSRVTEKEPLTLYQPMSYILALGGKRLRPVLTLLSTDLFGGNYKDAFNAAMAVEYFHNFSLIHDDIMDAAPLRRGKTTVHQKWDINTGILSGDAMLIEAYRFWSRIRQLCSKNLPCFLVKQQWKFVKVSNTMWTSKRAKK